MGVYNAEGRYRARIGLAKLVKSKSGNMQIRMSLEILGRYSNDGQQLHPCSHEGQYAPSMYLTITDQTMGSADQPGWLYDTLTHMGFNGDFASLAIVEGYEGDFVCKHEADLKGQFRESWSLQRPRSEGPDVDKSEIRQLNTRYSRLFKRAPAAPAPATPAPAAPRPPTPRSEQEPIPF